MRTHRLGGWVMGGLGLALVLAGVLGRSEWIRVLVGGTVVPVVSVMAFSYFVAVGTAKVDQEAFCGSLTV